MVFIMAYSGKFIPFNLKKYKGDPSNIIYRSLWERNVMKWLDESADVVEWASEEIAIKYYNPVKGSSALYYPDFYVKFKNGVTKIIEVKPKKETVKPVEPKRKTQNYLTEVATYAINQEKWKSAVSACKNNQAQFEVWTEDTLTLLGITKEMYSQPKPKVKNIKKRESNKKRLKPLKRPKRRS